MKLAMVFTCLLFFQTAGAATTNCMNGFEDKAGQVISNSVTASLIDFFKSKKIPIDPSEISVQAAGGYIFDQDRDNAPGKKYGSFSILDTNIVSLSGTKFRIYFSGPSPWQSSPFYNIVGQNEGFDREGNPINGHCSLRISRPSDSSDDNYATSIEVRNASSEKVIGSFALPAKIQLY